MKFRQPNSSALNRNKIQLLLQRMRERLSTKEDGTFDSAIRSIYNIFEKFFTTLGKPMFKPLKLRKGDDPEIDVYNDTLTDLQHDLRTGFEEAAQAGAITIGTFNASQIAAEELNQRSNLAASKTVDLRLLAGQLDQEVLIAGDDFQNTDRVDLAFPLQNPQAEVRVKEGIVTLNRLESVPVTNVDTRVSVTPLKPLGINTLPTTDNTNRFYEGNFFDYIGQARPEGDTFHLEERLDPQLNEFADGDSEIIVQSLEIPEEVINNAIDQRVPGEPRTVGLPLRPEDVLVIDRGATPEEKAFARAKMVDGIPDSFWECEYTVHSEEVNNFVTGLDVDGQIDRGITPAQIRAVAVEQDVLQNIDLEVQITLELAEEVPVNWISVNPMNFGETTWLEITEVSTSSDGQSGFRPVEGFDQNRFANVLTDEANEELQEDIVSDVLSPSRFAFRGTAVYTFPLQQAKFVRIKVKQRVPVPDPYQRLVLQLNRTIEIQQDYSRGDGGGKGK